MIEKLEEWSRWSTFSKSVFIVVLVQVNELQVVFRKNSIKTTTNLMNNQSKSNFTVKSLVKLMIS